MARVAVDAMGGDFAPTQIVAGAVAARKSTDATIILVGKEKAVHEALAESGTSLDDRLQFVEAPDVIPMDDPDPAKAVRTRRGSSVMVACRLVREDKADAMFSAGPTGATLAAAVVEMGRIRGAARPAITLVLPYETPTVLIDAGANADVRPEHMAGFGVLGSVFAEVRLGIDVPRVGLLSVGEEDGKGNELTKAVFKLLSESDLNFAGNVEARDLGSVDVIVTDGFTGNVVLKLLEGFAKFVMGELLKIFNATPQAQEAFKTVAPSLMELRRVFSAEATGGAQLLGVQGVCIIGHGASSPEAVTNGIAVAADTADAGLVDRVTQRLGRGRSS